MGFFKGFRNTMSNVAQIVLIVILFPFVAIVLGSISGTSSIAGVLISLIGKVPLCDVWVDVLYQYSGGLTAEDVVSSTVLVILKAFPEALIAAICVYICITISKKLKSRGLPIFATFVGIVASSVITSLTGLSGNVTAEIFTDFGVLIIMFIGLKIMFKSVFNSISIFSFKKIMLFIIDGLVAVITTAYISGLIMTAAGYYTSVSSAIGRLTVLAVIELVAALIAGFVGDAAEKDPTVF
ncbi:MAG: hypothetical protein NC122_09765 [Faecalibacterium sp.]|nr:hypothetical protein [Ruminococcus sp.]MCM1486477.1 hypothetical protein [Faecalibacterium sp.]